MLYQQPPPQAQSKEPKTDSFSTDSNEFQTGLIGDKALETSKPLPKVKTKLNKLFRWSMFSIGSLFLVSIYVIWKDYDRYHGGGFINGFLRGGIVFGGLAFLWAWAKNSADRPKDGITKILKEEPDDFSNAIFPENFSTVPVQPSTNEDRIYTAIAQELEDNILDKGLWTRLYVECKGDEKRTMALYIKKRAEILVYYEKLRLQYEAYEQAKEQAKEIARQQEQARIDSLSKRKKLIEESLSIEQSEKLDILKTTSLAEMMLFSVARHNLREVRVLVLEEPLLVMVKNRSGNTPLHIAICEKDLSMVLFLLENGANENAKNNLGITPLEYAIKSQQIEMVRLLNAIAK